jgi:hypothetical protein
MCRTALFSLGLVVCFAVPAGAQVITSAPAGSTSITMPATDYEGWASQTISPEVTWSTNNFSVYGYTGEFGFGSNGLWDGGLGPMIGLDSGTGAMTLAFSSPVDEVGGFFNFSTDFPDPATIAIYNADDQLIASYNLALLTNGQTDSGQWLGFSESTADISYLTMSNDYIGATDLSYTAPQVVAAPEGGAPLLYLLLSAAVCCGAFFLKRRAGVPAGRLA